MSTNIAPAKSRLWLDGDAYRASANTVLPTDIFAATLTGWDALGGIKAGFSLATARDVTEIDIWNNETGASYRRFKKTPKPVMSFRAVEYTKAVVLTLLFGGTVSETTVGSGIWEWLNATDETFAMIWRVYDGTAKKAYYMNNGELVNVPTEDMGTTEDDVEGFDFQVGPLAPLTGTRAVRKFTNSNPLV